MKINPEEFNPDAVADERFNVNLHNIGRNYLVDAKRIKG